jgi:hypothetical protein
VSRIVGSIAAEACREAQAILRHQPTFPPTCRLPFDYQPPAGDGWPASSPRVAGAGPFHSALTAPACAERTSRQLVEDAIAAAEASRNLNGVAALDSGRRPRRRRHR